MISLLFAATILVQAANPSPAVPEAPAHLRFTAPPEGLADPTVWSGNDVRFTEWGQTEGTPAFDYLAARGVCTAGATCELEGRFEHNIGPDADAPTAHIDRFVLAGPAGRLEAYAHQSSPQVAARFFRLEKASWLEIGSDHSEYRALTTFHKYLSARAAAVMQQQQQQQQPQR